MKKNQKLHWQTFVLLVYYLLIAFWFRNQGIDHSEALFIGQKIRTVIESNGDILGTTSLNYPSFLFYASFIFSWAGYTTAPIIVSCFATSLIFRRLVLDIRLHPENNFLILITTLVFLIHPGIIYTAVSGGSAACVLFFFYLVYRSLFRFFHTGISYYLSLAGIYLTALIFCDYRFLWLAPIFLPLMILISLNGVKSPKQNSLLSKYCDTVNNRSLRRKLLQRTIGLFLIIFLLPVGAFTFYTAFSRYSWEGFLSFTKNYSPNPNLFLTNIGELQPQIFLLSITTILPLLFIGLLKTKTSGFLSALTPIVLIFILSVTSSINFSIEYNLILLILAFILLTYCQSKGKKLFRYSVIAATVINIAGGAWYFSKTENREEKTFASRILKGPQNVSENGHWAEYLSALKQGNEKILMDDAAAYGIAVKMSLQNVILGSTSQFLTAAEDPAGKVKYILIAKNENEEGSKSILNETYLRALKKFYSFNLLIIHQTKNWMLLKF